MEWDWETYITKYHSISAVSSGSLSSAFVTATVVPVPPSLAYHSSAVATAAAAAFSVKRVKKFEPIRLVACRRCRLWTSINAQMRCQSPVTSHRERHATYRRPTRRFYADCYSSHSRDVRFINFLVCVIFMIYDIIAIEASLLSY